MAVDPATETRVFGRLVLRGILAREAVEGLFAQARQASAAGRAVSLAELAVGSGLIEEGRLRRLLATDGDDAPDLPGYRYLRKLGQGGTASVFAVERAKDGAVEAVKVLHEEAAGDALVLSAFLAEAKLLQRLEHPNVVKGHRAGRFAGRYLSFMECVEGRTLQEAIAAGGAFDEHGALFVVLQVARALQYLRSQGVVHRDIKPGNILVDGQGTVKVIDLGFALSAASPASEASSTVGTAAFLSPEQARGQADLDVRADIYALGATLYQLVLGELPFQAGTSEELVAKAVLEGLSAQATKGGRISNEVHYFLERMMAKDREHRYQDPEQLMADIEQVLAGRQALSIEPDPDDSAEMLQRRLARLRKQRGKRGRG